MADPATSPAAQTPASSPSEQTAETSVVDAQAATAESPVPGQPSGAEASSTEDASAPGFGQRGRMRRRLRFMRKARELAYRDLGGLVFEMHRLGERHDELAAAKLATLGAIDTELRTLENALGDRHAVTVLREPGIAACPRCAAIHGSEDRFCPACGTPMDRHADRPIATPGIPPAQSASSSTTAPGGTAPGGMAPGGMTPGGTAPSGTAHSAVQAAPGWTPAGPDGKPSGATGGTAAAVPAAPRAPATTGAASSTPTPRQAESDDRPTEIIRPSDATAPDATTPATSDSGATESTTPDSAK